MFRRNIGNPLRSTVVELTTQRTPSVALPEVRHEVLEVHGAAGRVVAPVVHLAASGGTNRNRVPETALP
jgi:hypothetical protein